MPTQSQIDANRRNAAKSTGPRTEAGRQNSRWNALKSGLHAQSLVLPCEDRAEYDQLQADLTAEHQPSTRSQRILVDMIVASTWRHLRLLRAESEIYTREKTRCSKYDEFRPEIAIVQNLGIDNETLRLQSMINSVERSYHRAEAALRRAKKDPVAEPAPPDAVEAPPIDATSVETPEPDVVPQPVDPSPITSNETNPISPPQPTPADAPERRVA